MNEPDESQLVLKSIAGSHLYNLNTESSDMDIRGIFLPSVEDLCNVSGEQNTEIADDDQDIKFYSIKKFLTLASQCNPNIIELLYLPESAILFKSNVYDELVAIRDAFMSKRAFHTFTGYAYAQIKRAKGIGKKGNSMDKYVNQIGIEKLRMYLSRPPLNNYEYLLSFCPEQMISRLFGKFMVQYLKKLEPYKWNVQDLRHQHNVDFLGLPEVKVMLPPARANFINWLTYDDNGFPFRPVPFKFDTESQLINNVTDDPKYDAASVEGSTNLYRLYHRGTGFLTEDENMVVCHSISKERERTDFAGVVRIDIDGYTRAKKEYDSFWEWMANRNEARYTKDWNSETCVDYKNLMHTMRLLLCAESIAKTGVPIVRFEGEQRDYLMSIRQGKVSYEDILAKAEGMVEDLKVLFDKSSIKNSADIKTINKFCENTMRKIFLS